MISPEEHEEVFHWLYGLSREAPFNNWDHGRCQFREVCGGSHARAYAVTGDCLAPDPSCAYELGERGDHQGQV